MNFQFEQYDKTNKKHRQAGAQISVGSIASDAMCSLYPEMFEELPYCVEAFLPSTNIVLGHIAVKVCDPAGISEIGGLWVSPRHRRQGVARGLIEHITGTAKSVLPGMGKCVAKANQNSLPRFLAAGGRVVDELPCRQNGAFIVDLTDALKPPAEPSNLLHWK